VWYKSRQLTKPIFSRQVAVMLALPRQIPGDGLRLFSTFNQVRFHLADFEGIA